MAFATQGSTQYNQQTGVTPGGAYGGETAGQLHTSLFEYTHTAAQDTGEINLVILPPGSLVVYPFLSAHGVSVAWVLNSTVQFGTRAYTQPNGVAVAQAVGALSTALVVSNAAVATRVMDVPANGRVLKLNSQGGVTIYATVATAAITVGGTLFGWVTWADPS